MIAFFIAAAFATPLPALIPYQAAELRRSSSSKAPRSGRTRSVRGFTSAAGGSTGGPYRSCAAARAAGAAPVRTGDAGYSRRLDRDGDGVGCE